MEYFSLTVIVILAIWLSPFILICLLIYFGFKIKKYYLRKKLLQKLQQEWFSKGKRIFFLYSDSKKWKDHFEKKVIPKIKKKAVICNWSTRFEEGWDEKNINYQVFKLFKPLGSFCPLAIVFLPDGKIKTFQFYELYIKKLKSNTPEYDRMEKEFFELVTHLDKNTSHNTK